MCWSLGDISPNIAIPPAFTSSLGCPLWLHFGSQSGRWEASGNLQPGSPGGGYGDKGKVIDPKDTSQCG